MHVHVTSMTAIEHAEGLLLTLSRANMATCNAAIGLIHVHGLLCSHHSSSIFTFTVTVTVVKLLQILLEIHPNHRLGTNTSITI